MPHNNHPPQADVPTAPTAPPWSTTDGMFEKIVQRGRSSPAEKHVSDGLILAALATQDDDRAKKWVVEALADEPMNEERSKVWAEWAIAADRAVVMASLLTNVPSLDPSTVRTHEGNTWWWSVCQHDAAEVLGVLRQHAGGYPLLLPDDAGKNTPYAGMGLLGWAQRHHANGVMQRLLADHETHWSQDEWDVALFEAFGQRVKLLDDDEATRRCQERCRALMARGASPTRQWRVVPSGAGGAVGTTSVVESLLQHVAFDPGRMQTWWDAFKDDVVWANVPVNASGQAPVAQLLWGNDRMGGLPKYHATTSMEKSPSEKRFPLFNASALIEWCQFHRGWTPQYTTDLAYGLYAKGDITYPRSVSVHVPLDDVEDMPQMLGVMAQRCPNLRAKIAEVTSFRNLSSHNNEDDSSPDHAIIPTLNAAPTKWTEDERWLYEAIAQRLIQQCVPLVADNYQDDAWHGETCVNELMVRGGDLQEQSVRWSPLMWAVERTMQSMGSLELFDWAWHAHEQRGERPWSREAMCTVLEQWWTLWAKRLMNDNAPFYQQRKAAVRCHSVGVKVVQWAADEDKKIYGQRLIVSATM